MCTAQYQQTAKNHQQIQIQIQTWASGGMCGGLLGDGGFLTDRDPWLLTPTINLFTLAYTGALSRYRAHRSHVPVLLHDHGK